jgi:FkbM family methyltransferase
LKWLSGNPPLHIRLPPWNLSIPEKASFLSNYRFIFCDRIYDFQSTNPSPYILDLGANIGLSVLFFKQRFPQSHIVALEPDPLIFPFLESNISKNGYNDVILRQEGAWNHDATLPFQTSFADNGHIIMDETHPSSMFVKVVDIRQILSSYPFDFIKMDIEGSEIIVLPACQPYLPGVKYLFIEYHSNPNQPQGLAEILQILESSGFRYSIETVWRHSHPFHPPVVTHNRYDFQANIYACRQ